MAHSHTDPLARTDLVLYAKELPYITPIGMEDWADYVIPMDEGSGTYGVYTWSNLDPAKTYNIIEQLGVEPDSADVEEPIHGSFGVDLSAAVAELAGVVEADQVIELIDGSYVMHTYLRGTTTKLIPDKVLKQPSGSDITNPNTQRFGGAAQESE